MSIRPSCLMVTSLAKVESVTQFIRISPGLASALSSADHTGVDRTIFYLYGQVRVPVFWPSMRPAAFDSLGYTKGNIFAMRRRYYVDTNRQAFGR